MKHHPYLQTEETKLDDTKRIIIDELRAALGRVADASFETAVAYDVVEQMLKEQFIINTHRRFLERGDEATQSQIGFFTGIHTRDIGTTLNSRNRPPIPLLSIEERIVKLWAGDPDFHDGKTGQPATLLKYGSGHTFQLLVRRVTRGVTPRTAADWLLGHQVVKIVNKFWVRLEKPDWTPGITDRKLHRFLLALRARGNGAG